MRHIGIVICMVAASVLPPVAHASQCRYSFEQFLARFESDWEFQLQHVRFPLRMGYVDGAAYPEPLAKEKLVSRDAYMAQGNFYPSPDIQAERRLQKKIVRSPDSTMVIEFDQPDSDSYTVDFKFTRMLGCWYLTFIDDHSL